MVAIAGDIHSLQFHPCDKPSGQIKFIKLFETSMSMKNNDRHCSFSNHLVFMLIITLE